MVSKSKNNFTERVPTVAVEATVGDVERLLLDSAKHFDSIHYVYVLDAEKKLQGVLSIKDVFRQPKAMPVARFMQKSVISTRVSTRTSQISYIALRHNIKAVPLVDKDGVFKGVVTGDMILHNLYRALTADMFRFAGAPGASKHAEGFDNILHLSLPRMLLHRLPWLLVGLIGGLGVAQIVGFFEELLSTHIVLVTFLPLVVYMADAVATQANAFIIRDLAIAARINFLQYVFKELRNDVFIATIVALLLFTANMFMGTALLTAIAVSTALFTAVSTALVTGIIVPYVLSRFRVDPANGTGPLATILQDMFSVLIYFTVVSLFF